jgi:hypothetical protein
VNCWALALLVDVPGIAAGTPEVPGAGVGSTTTTELMVERVVAGGATGGYVESVGTGSIEKVGSGVSDAE